MKDKILIMSVNKFYRRTIGENEIVYKQYTFDTNLKYEPTKNSIVKDVTKVLKEMENRNLSKKEMRAYKKYNALVGKINLYYLKNTRRI